MNKWTPKRKTLKIINENVLFAMPCNCFPQHVCVWLRIFAHTIRSVQLQQHCRVPFRISTLQMTWGRSLALFHFLLDSSKLKLCLVRQTPQQAKLLRLSLPLNFPLWVGMLGRGKKGQSTPWSWLCQGHRITAGPKHILLGFLSTAISEK